MTRYIIVKTTFAAIHNWPEAKGEVQFLSLPHRHLFFIEIKCQVQHNNRDLEFLTLKKELDRYINDKFLNKNIGSKSCEDIAEDILLQFNAYSVKVFEDNENGAELSI